MGGFEGDGDLSPDEDPPSPDPTSYPLDYVEAMPDSLDLASSDLALAVKVPAIPAPAVGVVVEDLPDSLDLASSDLALAVKVLAIPAPAVGVVGEALPDSLDLTTPVLALVFGVVENIAVTPALETSSLASSTEVLVFENNVLVIRGCINAVDVIKAAPSAPTFEVEDDDYLLLGQGFDDTTESDEEGQKRRALLTATVGTSQGSLPTDKTTIVAANTAGNRIAGKRKRAPSPPLRPAVKTMSTVTSTTKKRTAKDLRPRIESKTTKTRRKRKFAQASSPDLNDTSSSSSDTSDDEDEEAILVVYNRQKTSRSGKSQHHLLRHPRRAQLLPR
jgi:hypothetical protein